MNAPDLLRQAHARRWFYEFDLPDGTTTPSYLPPGVAQIHTTRLAMLWQGACPARRRLDGTGSRSSTSPATRDTSRRTSRARAAAKSSPSTLAASTSPTRR